MIDPLHSVTLSCRDVKARRIDMVPHRGIGSLRLALAEFACAEAAAGRRPRSGGGPFVPRGEGRAGAGEAVTPASGLTGRHVQSGKFVFSM
jgi:hypothetical protein